jgi:hypothetical protein
MSPRPTIGRPESRRLKKPLFVEYFKINAVLNVGIAAHNPGKIEFLDISRMLKTMPIKEQARIRF